MDGLLYTFLMVLELEARGLIDMIYPILIGDYDVFKGKISHYFNAGCHSIIENNVVVTRVQQKVSFYLFHYGLGDPLLSHLSVQEILARIVENPEHIIVGHIKPALTQVLQTVKNLIIRRRCMM
jgi:hypothetical protein